MRRVVLIAHADGEEEVANEFVRPLKDAGYDVDCRGFTLVGESLLDRENRTLALGGPIVLCGTRRAAGSESVKSLVKAAKFDAAVGVRIFPVRLETDVNLSNFVTEDIHVADFTKDRAAGMQQLLKSISVYYPIETAAPPRSQPIKPVVLPYPSLGPLFKGRDEFMEQLHKSLTGKGKTAITAARQALYGLGGIGKTRAAVEYAWAHEDEYNALLFVVAETPETLGANLVTLTRVLAPETDKADDNIRLQAVVGWLAKNPGWFLILDNVDSKKALAAVENLLKDLRGGRIVITSRLSDFSANFAPLPLDVLPLGDAVAFLLERTEGRRRKSPDDEADSHQIATELDGLALALEQAAAYISKRRLTFESYLDQWRSAGRDKVLDWFDETITGYKRAVAVTWQTSVMQLTESGRRMLERLAWLAPEPVPNFLLDVPVPGAETERLPDTLDNLAAYSLVTRHAEGPFFLVHRLVQDVTRRSLVGERRQRSLEEALKWIGAAFPEDPTDVRSWPRADLLAPHARALIVEADRVDITTSTARLMNQFGAYLQAKALYVQAKPYFERSLAIYEEALGPDHQTVGVALNNFAVLYRSQGRYAEAEPLYQRSLAIREKVFGADHPDVGTTLNNLAGLYAAQGRYAEAEPLYQRALTIRERGFGPDDARVGESLSNLAELFRAQGRYAEAVSLCQRSLAIKEKAFGPDHPTVGTTIHNLANLYRLQGRLAEAESLYERDLAISEKALGPEHRDVGTALGNLAGLYRAQGRHTEAEPLFRRSLTIIEKTLGPDHPDVATVLNNLAGFYHTQGRLAEAEVFYTRSLLIREKALGSNHDDIANSLNNLATLCVQQQRLDEASTYMRRCLSILLTIGRQIDRAHPYLELALNNYVGVLSELGRTQAQIKQDVDELMGPGG